MAFYPGGMRGTSCGCGGILVEKGRATGGRERAEKKVAAVQERLIV